VDRADEARSVTSPEIAAEVHPASLLAVEETTTMEPARLDRRARHLILPRARPAQRAQQSIGCTITQRASARACTSIVDDLWAM
jgi:uncharacterized membrane protein YebE (DUF533 family)